MTNKTHRYVRLAPPAAPSGTAETPQILCVRAWAARHGLLVSEGETAASASPTPARREDGR